MRKPSALHNWHRLATQLRIFVTLRHAGLWRSGGSVLGLLILSGNVPPVQAGKPGIPPSAGTTRTRRGELAGKFNRIALVVGETAYANVPLRNPANDARAIAATLGRLGFDVKLVINVARDSMKKEIVAFGDKIQNDRGGTALFYYAGHGVQAAGVNYLVPITANIRREADFQFEAIDVNLVLAQMQDAPDSTNLVILDACRDNPFSTSRGGPVGLASVGAPQGTLIAYATAPGHVAEDGLGRNGEYTSALLQYLPRPELPVEALFKRVRLAVVGATAGRQVPWEATSLTGEFYFARGVDSGVVDVAYAPVVEVPIPIVGGGKPLVYDDFSNRQVLFQGANSTCSFAYVRGSYSLANKSTRQGCWTLYPGDLRRRVRIETRARAQNLGQGTQFSLLIGASEEGFHNFVIAGDGYFYVERYSAGTRRRLIPPTPTKEIQLGVDATNRIAVEVDTRHVTFLINGVNVGNYDVAEAVVGQVGFGVGPGTSVAFDFLHVEGPAPKER